MKPSTIAIIPALVSALIATSAAAQNAASAPVRGPVAYGAPVTQSRVQQWYSDTGWQPGSNAVQSYGYGYGYGGAGHAPHAVIAPTPEPIQQAQSHGYQSYGYQGHGYQGRSFQPGVSRSMPFGYVVDGFGRYPWQRGASFQQAAHYGTEHYSHYESNSYHHGPAQCPPPVAAPAPAPEPLACPYAAPAPVPVEPLIPQPADSGYFAVPAPAPVSSTEIPYRQEIGERG